MIAFGCLFNPLSLSNWMNINNIRYSVDKVVLNRNNIIFSSFTEFARYRHQLKRKRIFIFDCKEKLNYIDNITLCSESKIDYVQNFLLNNDLVGPKIVPKVNVIKPIKVLIEKNKSMGVLHDYTSVLYKIKKSSREEIKNFVAQFLQGKVDIKHLDNLIKQTEDTMRQSKMKEHLNYVFSMLKSEGFASLRKAMLDLLKIKVKVERSHVEDIALKYQVEPFDLHYFYSVIQKQKGVG